MKKNIGIVGSSGYISKYLSIKFIEHSWAVTKFDVVAGSDVILLDLADTGPFDTQYLDDIDILVFTAAVSQPDVCEREYEKAWQINVVGTSRIIKCALDKGKRVIFFSSDAVFGCNETSILTETSPTEASTAYGKMKKAVEDEFKDNPLFKVIRLSYVVSAQDRFTSYCLRCIDANEIAEIYHPFYRNCITLGNVCDAVIWLIENEDKYPNFALHMCGTELVSRIRIADELNRVFDNSLKYKIVCPSASFYSNRPAIAHLESEYLYILGILESKNFTRIFREELKIGN